MKLSHCKRAMLNENLERMSRPALTATAALILISDIVFSGPVLDGHVILHSRVSVDSVAQVALGAADLGEAALEEAALIEAALALDEAALVEMALAETPSSMTLTSAKLQNIARSLK